MLIHAEQGFGDTLQFVRFVPLAAQRAGTRRAGSAAAAAALARARRTSLARMTLIAQGAPRPAADRNARCSACRSRSA